MRNIIKRADFTSVAPAFILNNKTKVKTHFGGVVSISTITILLIYFSLNLISMIDY
jgi:hypothetical protein